MTITVHTKSGEVQEFTNVNKCELVTYNNYKIITIQYNEHKMEYFKSKEVDKMICDEK